MPEVKTTAESMALTSAEKRIQRILLDLEEEAGKRIDQVNVDTRNYANCSVEIFLTERQRR